MIPKGEVYLGSILTCQKATICLNLLLLSAKLAKHNIKVNIEPYESGTMFESSWRRLCYGYLRRFLRFDASGYATVHGSSAMGH